LLLLTVIFRQAHTEVLPSLKAMKNSLKFFTGSDRKEEWQSSNISANITYSIFRAILPKYNYNICHNARCVDPLRSLPPKVDLTHWPPAATCQELEAATCLEISITFTKPKHSKNLK
jgi:hypothetical protein